jgi:hypothetical protein
MIDSPTARSMGTAAGEWRVQVGAAEAVALRVE